MRVLLEIGRAVGGRVAFGPIAGSGPGVCRSVGSSFRLGAASAVLLITASAAPALGAQERVIIEGGCTDCGISVRRALTLGGPDLPFEFSTLMAVALNSRNQVIAASILNPGSFAIFNPDGSLEAVVGRYGRGPGEYGRISEISVGPSDSILVADGSEISVTSASGDFARRIRARGRPASMAFSTGGIFLFAPGLSVGRRPPDRVTHYPAGSIESSTFGPAPVTVTEDNLDQTLGALAWSPSRDALWVASQPRYELALFRDGDPTLVIERHVAWFEPWDRAHPEAGSRVPPPPRLSSLFEDDQGRVWSATVVADAHWTPKDPSELRPDVFEPSDVFDTIIEVLDTSAGMVLAHQRFDELLTLVGSSPMAYAMRSDVIGRVLIDVFTLEIP